MADWLKVNHALVRSPKVRGLMRALHCKKHAALGLAVSWLCWVDEQTTDGHTGLLPDELDDEIGFRGCAEALISIGWAALGADGCVYALEFGKHCGETAKKRADDARRQAEKRKRDADASRQESQEVSRGMRDACHEKHVTRKEKNNMYRKGELSTTVDIGAAAVPSPPAPDGFFDWLAQIGVVVPMLRRLNLDHPLPRKVEAAARQAAALVRLTPEVLEQLQRYYAADSVSSYRPDSLEFFFGDLPDVLQHAANWCKADDREQRKAAATARRKAKEREQEASRTPMTEEARKEFFECLRGFSGGEGGEA